MLRSDASGMIECMFEGESDAGLLEVMREAQRAERVAVARGLLAVGRFGQRRWQAAGDEHGFWCVDDWDVIAAEVAAELGIGRGRASSRMHYGQTLLERLPRLADVFAAGQVDFRVIAVIIYRTDLVTDAAAIARIDEMVARRAPNWNKLSYPKVTQLVDWLVLEVDPDALRVARQRDEDRHIEVGPAQYGMAEIWGNVRATDAAALDQKLDALAGTVCGADPRTKRQRRADALSALATGNTALACMCGSDRCPVADAAGQSASGIVIHVLAEAATVEGTSDKPGYLSGYGALPAATITELAKRARLRPVIIPTPTPQPQYRPSTALGEFIRCRDLTCRWMGCDKPAWTADIDHTVPYPLGPTHASNNACYCRFHHLLKTFFCGPGGWSERQLPDATIIFTSPSGRRYSTTPAGALFFPQLALPTGEPILPTATSPPSPLRGLCMPTRKQTRAQHRASRIQWERNLNAARYAADPPPF
jgi:hypothetical protein